MNAVANYQIIEQIHESQHSLVYRATLQPNNEPIIVKILKEKYPAPAELTRYKQEYELTRSLNVDSVIQAIDLQRYENSLAMLLEDFGGQSLNQLLKKQKLSLKECLKIAIQITEGLKNIHNNTILHKDINPSNLVYNPKTRQLKIIDFGIATRLSRENPTIRNPNRLEGTLAYISPEQTGRMNRGIDYRSDFYSFGVTFYELLTHQLPFESNDPMELIHCHIAQHPKTPHDLQPSIPPAISNIVMKLLAKTPEERYQSAWGLKADLETCLDHLHSGEQIPAFSLGDQDICDRFCIPERLYGREREVTSLLDTFERVSQGAAEMMLVSGYSGIGKSALVNEIHKPILQQRGYFISGKFDQLKRDIPYEAIIRAFQDLIRQLLTESEIKLKMWREQILAALGVNARVIIDIIPELEQIVGTQPPVPQLDPLKAQNRLGILFQRFLSVFSTQDHPLVIFLDDLQWADLPSLQLIELLMTDPDRQYFFMIGAYRDNEVSPTHPLIQTVEQIKKTGAFISHIILKPLELEHINQLIADTLNCPLQQSSSLAELSKIKTEGNPFFLTQLLHSLEQEKLFLFNSIKKCWEWNIEEIKQVGITDNVIDLMIGKIEKLDKKTQEILKIASCIGNQFSLKIISFVNGNSKISTAREIQNAIEEGLILPLSEDYKIPLFWDGEETLEYSLNKASSLITQSLNSISYKFLHDRVQQASYALIPEQERQQIHLQIGSLLLENTKNNQLEENLFNIVNQLNVAAQLITQQSDKNNLAQLNLQAGRKAKASAAYEPALNYFMLGLELLAPNCWNDGFNLTLELHLEHLEALFLNTKFEKVEACSKIILQQVREILNKVKVYEIIILSYRAQFNSKKALETSLQTLNELGVKITQEVTKMSLEEMIIASLNSVLEKRRIEDLINLPEMTDPYKLAVATIIQSILTTAWTTNFPLCVKLILTQIEITMQFGNPPQSPSIYIHYAGILLSGILGDIDSAYRFGQLSIKLLEKFNALKLEAELMHIYYGWIWHFKQFIRKDVAQKKLLNGIQRGIDTGNHEYTSYVSMDYCLIRLFCGDNLDNVEQNYKKYTNLVLKLKQQYSFSYIKVCHKIVINLIQGYLGNLCLVAGDSEEEENKSIKNWENNAWLLFITYLGKALNYYLVKDYNSAIYSIIFADKYVLPIKAFLLETQHYFFFSLIIFSYYNTCNTEQKKQFLEITVQNQKKMKYWASHCRENFQHKYDLIEAEKARVLGNHWEAENLYEKAIQGAKKYEFIHEEAIAYERGAEFYFSLDRQEIGNLYLRNAHHCYSLWGAKAKVRQLEEEYPQLLINTALRQSKTTINIVSTTGSDTLESLDLSTVIKASQALAGEIQLDKLLEQLMSIAIENAGAQKGLLILKRDNNWVIEAQRSLNSQETTTLQSIPIDSPNPHQPPLLSPAIANYVIHSKETVVLNDAVNEGQYIRDPYIVATQPKSILCTPLINQGKLSGILYLENNLTTNAFTSDRVELLRTLSAQAAISIENARLYHQLEDYNQTLEQQVAERTEQLQQKNEELTQTLQELKTTQDELIQSEKMAALGQLVAGIAHEINTPLGAIRAAIGNTDKALQASLSQIPQLLPQLNPQQQTDFFSFLEQSLQSQPSLSTREKRQIKRTVTQHLQSHDIANAQQLAHLLTEGGLHDSFESQLSLLQTPQAYQIVQTAYDIARLHANSQTINNAVERAAKIVFALKSYARYDHSGEKQSFQITDNIETVLELYQNYLKKGVEVVRHYQPVPEISGYPDELVQVWTNLIHNAIQAMEGKGILEILVRQQEYDIVVEVTDSGCGIPPEIQDKIFQPFFTTKPAGEGSGLGLDIVQKIIEKHQGTITFVSVPSHTTFTVVLPRQ